MANAENAPVALCNLLRQDALGSWLPFALADLLRAQLVKPPSLEDIFRSWGLEALADQMAQAREAQNAEDVIAFFQS